MLEFYAELKAAVRGWALALRDRLQRTTPRERLLLIGLLLGALIYAPIAALDWRTNQETRYIDALSDRSAARLTREAARRIASRAPDQSAIEDMKTWGFDAHNVQIAQVYIEQALVKSAEEAGLTNVRITTDVAVETIGAVTWLGAQVQADLRWTPAFAFLDDLTSWPEGFRVKQFQYSITPITPMMALNPNPSAPLGRVQFGLAFPVNLPAATPAATAPKSQASPSTAQNTPAANAGQMP